jgi:tyrosyl-tRNA synthetase
MPAYFQYATAWPPELVEETTKQLADGELHPNAAKRLLARTVVDLYHGEGAGSAAEAEFDRVFKDHAAPDVVPDKDLTTTEPQLLSRWLHEAELATSNREAVRSIEQGSVKIDGEAVTENREWAPDELHGKVVQVGKRKWARIHSNR